jgi:hypothetical protein
MRKADQIIHLSGLRMSLQNITTEQILACKNTQERAFLFARSMENVTATL